MEDREFKYCLRCGRRLKSSENRKRGYGKICYEKAMAKPKGKPLFKILPKSVDKRYTT